MHFCYIQPNWWIPQIECEQKEPEAKSPCCVVYMKLRITKDRVRWMAIWGYRLGGDRKETSGCWKYSIPWSIFNFARKQACCKRCAAQRSPSPLTASPFENLPFSPRAQGHRQPQAPTLTSGCEQKTWNAHLGPLGEITLARNKIKRSHCFLKINQTKQFPYGVLNWVKCMLTKSLLEPSLTLRILSDIYQVLLRCQVMAFYRNHI